MRRLGRWKNQEMRATLLILLLEGSRQKQNAEQLRTACSFMWLLHLKSMFNVFFKEIGLWQSSCIHSVEGSLLSFIMRLLCLVPTALICQPPSTLHRQNKLQVENGVTGILWDSLSKTWWTGQLAQHNLAHLNLVSWAVQGLVRELLLTSVRLYLKFVYRSVNAVSAERILNAIMVRTHMWREIMTHHTFQTTHCSQNRQFLKLMRGTDTKLFICCFREKKKSKPPFWRQSSNCITGPLALAATWHTRHRTNQIEYCFI